MASELAIYYTLMHFIWGVKSGATPERPRPKRPSPQSPCPKRPTFLKGRLGGVVVKVLASNLLGRRFESLAGRFMLESW